eukprot:1645847-Amphidinium_carterae.1
MTLGSSSHIADTEHFSLRHTHRDAQMFILIHREGHHRAGILGSLAARDWASLFAFGECRPSPTICHHDATLHQMFSRSQLLPYLFSLAAQAQIATRSKQ